MDDFLLGFPLGHAGSGRATNTTSEGGPLRGRCPAHFLTYCVPCGFCDPADVEPLTYESIRKRATEDAAFREGLLAAALVCRSQGQESNTAPPCPSGMAAVYIERLAEGYMP